MAVYCTKCGAEMNENDGFCGMCGEPVNKAEGAGTGGGSAEKSGGEDTQKYKMIGIAVIAVVVLLAGSFVIKGIGGAKKSGREDRVSDGMAAEGAAAEEDDVLTHLTPWMGEWVVNNQVYPNQAIGYLHNWDIEGQYKGHILIMENVQARIHVNNEYIDLSGVTKNQKDRFPVSALSYYQTEYGADAFEDENSGIRIVFYDHFTCYDGGEDFGNVMQVQAYVGTEKPETLYIDPGDGSDPIPMGFDGHYPGPDGWASDMSATFVKTDE